MKRIGIGALVLLALIVTLGLIRGTQPAHAQDTANTGVISVKIDTLGADNEKKLNDHIASTTIFHNGVPVAQGDQHIGPGYSPGQFDKLTPGLYTVRIEGEGFKTFIKRNVLVKADRPTGVTIQLEPGKGTTVWNLGTVEARKCPQNAEHTEMSPDQWKFCPIDGSKLKE
jgi:hypothetical protein